MEKQLDALEKEPAKPIRVLEPGQFYGEQAIEASWRAAKTLGWAMLLLFVPIVNGIATPLLWVCAMAIALAGLVRALMWLVAVALSEHRASGAFVQRVVGSSIVNAFLLAFGFFMSLGMLSMFSRGRQLRSGNKVLLPDVEPGAKWTTLSLGADLKGEVAARLAAQWRENGRTEHASVGAFARLTLDLMALGAPPSLIASANRDALEEIRHTELCFSLARDLDGREESPGAFPAASKARKLPPVRTLALAALAVDSLVDGALHECVSARVIARLARTCEEPQIRAVLKEIAADEGRHAAHGWDVVEWCVKEGGAPVVAALHGALQALPDEMVSPLPEEAARGEWEKYGIHGHATEGEEYRKAVADLEKRVHALN